MGAFCVCVCVFSDVCIEVVGREWSMIRIVREAQTVGVLRALTYLLEEER